MAASPSIDGAIQLSQTSLQIVLKRELCGHPWAPVATASSCE
jgi:hypothetical protein